jgi:tRNA(Phe) wybutosine-synthesizing methylase Tyw3
MSEKINQFTTNTQCECVGRPALDGSQLRIKCKKKTTVTTKWHNRVELREVRRQLNEQGWHNIRTLGDKTGKHHMEKEENAQVGGRYWLCPSCFKYIEKMRSLQTSIWG